MNQFASTTSRPLNVATQSDYAVRETNPDATNAVPATKGYKTVASFKRFLTTLLRSFSAFAV